METDYAKYRALLTPYAYNITGDSLTAEDVVQEVLNAYFMNDRQDVESPEKYLMRSVINRSINAKKRINAEKKKYIGQWLPVPVQTDDSIYRDIDKRKILNYSLLVLLEKLNPKERAVFILKESFDFDHSEIAEVIGITTENARQLYRRGKEKLESKEIRVPLKTSQPDSTVKQLTDAILGSDVERVKSLLAEHVQSHSDGGGLRAARNVIAGREHVSKFLGALYGKYYYPDTTVSVSEMNHMPALIFRHDGEKVYRIMLFDVAEGAIENVYIINNPEKLRALM